MRFLILSLRGALTSACATGMAGLLPAAAHAGEFTSTSLQMQQLQFRDEPAWARRLERIGHEGLPLVEVRRNDQSRVVFGVTRKGFIGFFTVARPARRD
jgi:hypothetical protein